MEPVVVKKIAHERLTALVFRYTELQFGADFSVPTLLGI
jgi:hypothetical protein